MKLLKIKFLFILFLCPILIFGQENASMPERTPEQEAAKQTEKLQQELNLSTEQARQVHEINLKYARARQVSNTRMDAIQRIKDKEVELSRVLSEHQQSVLQNKRYEKSSFQPQVGNNQQRSVQQSESNRQPAKAIEAERNSSTVRQNNSTPTSTRQPTTNQPITTRPYSTGDSRSTFRNPTDSRSSSVRSSSPASNSAPKTAEQSKSQPSSTSRQPSPSGRR